MISIWALVATLGVFKTAQSPCRNGRRDGDETDVDCGGSECGPCDEGDRCRKTNDCWSPLLCIDQQCEFRPSPRPTQKPVAVADSLLRETHAAPVAGPDLPADLPRRGPRGRVRRRVQFGQPSRADVRLSCRRGLRVRARAR